MVDLKDSVVAITEDEAALYDRQIRLWGLDAQKRLRSACVLLIGVGGLGAEVAKNIVLSGVKSVTLLDHAQVTSEDLCSQFLVNRSDIGQNRASSSLHRTQQLNPMVEVTVDTDKSESKEPDYFHSFDVVCATCCTETELLRLDDICRQHNILFFAGDVFGFYGFMFSDLGEHDYAEEVISHTKKKESGESGEPASKKQRTDDQDTKTLKKHSSFVRLENALNADWKLEANAYKLNRMAKTYFIIRVLLEFRRRECRNPDTEHLKSDREILKTLRGEMITRLGLKHELVPPDFYNYCVGEVSPVCAITGGILGQEVIKAVSKKDAPHNNFFFFNGVEGSGMVENIGRV